MPKIQRIVIPLYLDFDILDVCGPLAMFGSVAGETGIAPVLATAVPGVVRCLQGVGLEVGLALPALSATDALWVPGGFGTGFNEQISATAPTTQWLAKEGPQAGYVCSVCTGSLILAAAGLLDGYTVTTHWLFQQSLAMFPRVRLASGLPRYWMDRNRLTGGGVSSGLDASLALIATIASSTAAMHAQLLNQYAPDPPFRCGSPLTAPPDVLGSFFQNFGDGAGALEQVVAAFLRAKARAEA